ncbi:MAG: hypothetical protein KKI08_14265 [Armatimonadetes bacterium]|nr:hypothetical protein [Armatimonadota bacterium]
MADHLAASDEAKGVYLDWEVTALFYAAVHLVDAALAGLSIHPTCHVQKDPAKDPGRNNLVEQRYRLVWCDYRGLSELSRRARYDADVTITAGDVARARRKYYANIKAMMTPTT